MSTSAEKDVDVNSVWYQNIKARSNNHRQPKQNQKVARRTSLQNANIHRAMNENENNIASMSEQKTNYVKNIDKESEAKKNTQKQCFDESDKTSFRSSLSIQQKTNKQQPTMTLLSKPTVTTPAVSATFLAITSNVSVDEKADNPSTKPSKSAENGWKKVPVKAKHQPMPETPKPIFYLPKVIPDLKPKANFKSKTENVMPSIIPISIRLKKHRFSNASFHIHRTITAMFIALQNVDPTIKLAVITNLNQPSIENPASIPTNDIELKGYYELPNDDQEQSKHLLCMRIHVESTTTFHQIQTNSTLAAWLRSESIQLDRNTLPTMKPQQAGYLTHHMVRPNIVSTYEQRLKQMMSPTCPPFMLQSKTIIGNYATTTVWNVLAEADQIDKVIKEFKAALNTKTLRLFISWKEQNAIMPDQQLKIVQLQNTFLTDYRSLIMTGFHDTYDTMMFTDDKDIEAVVDEEGTIVKYKFTNLNEDSMEDDCIETRFRNNFNLKETSVHEYIQQAFISGDGTPVFGHVFEQINGIREVLVPTRHIAEGIELIKVIQHELCRVMNKESIEMTFHQEAESMILQATEADQWEPFDIQSEIEAADTAGLTKTYQQPKRRRTKTSMLKARNGSPRSYAEATTGYRNNDHTSDSTKMSSNRSHSPEWRSENDLTTQSNEANDTLQQLLTEVTNANKEIKLIKSTVTQMDNKILRLDSSTKLLDSKIDEVATNAQQNDHRLEEQTTSKIESIQEESQKAIKTMSDLFKTTTKQAQTSTESFLQKLLLQQEERISQTISETLQTFADENNHKNTDNTRARKKSTRATEEENNEVMEEIEIEKEEKENLPQQEPTVPKATSQTSLHKYLNPMECFKNMQQHPNLRYRSGTPLPSKMQ